MCEMALLMTEKTLEKYDPIEGAAKIAKLNEEQMRKLNRAIELWELEQKGRLLVLPCKVGDWVYALWSVPTAARYVIYCAEVKEICYSVRNCRLTTTYRLEPIEYRGRRKEYFAEDFGKTVFLNREEAEEALKGEGEQ